MSFKDFINPAALLRFPRWLASLFVQFSTAVNEGRKSWPKIIADVVLSLFALSLAWQFYQVHGFAALIDRGLFRASAFVLVVSILFAIKPITAFVIVNAVLLVVAARVIGVRSVWIDGIIVLFAIILAFRLSRWQKLQPPAVLPKPSELLKGTWLTLRLPLTIFVALWFFIGAGIGLADIARDRGPLGLQRAPTHPTQIAPLYGDSTVRIGVALSGGGYRAALMHAGVLHMIDSIGIPIQVMSTVSGGSIVGAYYALGGEPKEFLRAAVEQRINLARNVFYPWTFARMVLSSRWGTSDYFVLPFFGDFTRTTAQAELLDQVFFRGAQHRHENEEARGRGHDIELMLCLTDIAGNAMVGVTPHGFIEQAVSPPTARFTFLSKPIDFENGRFNGDNSNALPGPSNLATLVAASGAFPGAFKPLRVQVVRPPEGGFDLDTSKLVLADGGMADNLGLVMMYAAGHWVRRNDSTIARADPEVGQAIRKWDVNVIIASDGSAISLPRVPTSGLQEIGSAIDVVSRASAGEPLAGPDRNPSTTLLSPDPFINLSPIGGIADLAFEHAGASDTMAIRRVTEDASIFQLPSFMTLSPVDLRFLVLNLDTLIVPRDSLLQAVRVIAQRNGRDSLTNSRDRARNQSWADELVHSALVADLSYVLTAFVKTPTLTSTFTPAKARALYRLGQYLFLFNRPYIAYAAGQAVKGRVPTKAAPGMGAVMQAGAVRGQATATQMEQNTIVRARRRVVLP
jgi:predicted acylesterase/phospholipase RssA